ncbi:MAG: ExeA family protein [Pirellulaceae bacterium]
MYETHWGLRESPFRGLTDPRNFYCSPTHDEALARLQFLVEHQRRLGLLLGMPGSGKTLLLEVFRRQLKAAGNPVASINLLSLGPHEFLWELARQLQRNPLLTDTPFALWRTVVDRLEEYRYQRLPTILLLDDADEMSPEIVPHIIRLLLQDPAAPSMLTVVLAADPARENGLPRRLLELCELRMELESWEPDDTRNFLQQSLTRAGTDQPVFERDATLRLHELAHGVPRQVNYLAELALVAGAGQQLGQISATTVESVFAELRPSF